MYFGLVTGHDLLAAIWGEHGQIARGGDGGDGGGRGGTGGGGAFCTD